MTSQRCNKLELVAASENDAFSLCLFCLRRPITLGQNMTSCVSDLTLCANGLTVAFWFKLTDPDRTNVQRLFYSAKDQTDVSITAKSNVITAAFFVAQSTMSVEFNVTFQQWHHVAFAWSQNQGLVALVDFVRSFRGGQSALTASAENVPIVVGGGATNVAVCMSHVVVYEVDKSVSEMQRIGKCTDLVSGERSQKSCQMFVKNKI